MNKVIGVVLRFLVTIAAVPLCAHFMDGVHAESDLSAIIVGAILAAIYVALRPLMRLILKVFNFCTLGLLNVAVDAWLIWTAAELSGKNVTFDSFWWAVAVAAVITALRMGIDILTGHTKK